MSSPLPADLSPLLLHLESAYPNEGCGLVLLKDGAKRYRPMANAYDRYHARDPERFPRTSRTAYFFDPKEQLLVYEECEAASERVICIVHSHADVGAYFSEEDRRAAAPDGEPLHPGIDYLVVAVDQGKSTAAKLIRFQGGDWIETLVPLTGP